LTAALQNCISAGVICDIFIKTCKHDRGYLEHCLRSIDKFCSGFRQVKIVEGEHPKGYLHQQVIKMHADTFTDADLFLITDSDTLFTIPVTPETYLRDGKPIWLHTPWTPEMLAHKGTMAWLECMTQFAKGVTPPSEFMRRQPFMIPGYVLEDLRETCLTRHGRTLEDYVMNAASFSEFNVIGHHAWMFFHDKFHWIDTSKDELPPVTVRQFWSHDPVEKNLPEIERILS
jgi:hypothetical protein